MYVKSVFEKGKKNVLQQAVDINLQPFLWKWNRILLFSHTTVCIRFAFKDMGEYDPLLASSELKFLYLYIHVIKLSDGREKIEGAVLMNGVNG